MTHVTPVIAQSIHSYTRTCFFFVTRLFENRSIRLDDSNSFVGYCFLLCSEIMGSLSIPLCFSSVSNKLLQQVWFCCIFCFFLKFSLCNESRHEFKIFDVRSFETNLSKNFKINNCSWFFIVFTGLKKWMNRNIEVTDGARPKKRNEEEKVWRTNLFQKWVESQVSRRTTTHKRKVHLHNHDDKNNQFGCIQVQRISRLFALSHLNVFLRCFFCVMYTSLCRRILILRMILHPV